jgi:gliding motility-associated-like protein
MRALFISACLLLLPLWSIAQSFLAIKDSAYLDNIGNGYLQYSLVAYNPVTCQDSLITVIDTAGYQALFIYDVAAGPSGEIYVLTFGILNSGAGEVCVSLLNTQNGSHTCLFDLSTIGFAGNSLVCSADSVLYAAGQGLASYDLKTGIGSYYGLFSNFFGSSGDMIFQNGELFLTGYGNQLMQVNIENPSASVIVASYPQLPPGREVWGIASNVYDCDSSDMFLMVGVQINNFDQREYDIYSLDFSTQQIGLLCTGAGAYYYTGSTTYNEFLTSDCSVRLDLDKNNSSGADSADYQVTVCGSGPVFVSDTSDMELYSGYRIDSLRLRLIPLMPGETLVADATPPTLTLTGQNSEQLTFSNPGNVLFHDFQSALRSVYWQYTGGGSPIPGQRTVEVIVFARGGRQDTAMAYLSLVGLPQAGRDTSIVRCANNTAFNLSALLSLDASPGGVWWPALPGDLFDPAIMATDTFQYIVSGGGECPPDTAVMTVVVQPTPVFSLGSDADLCMGDTLVLETSSVASWQGGTQATTTFDVVEAGLYWAEMTNVHGCTFRDSISVSLLPIQNTQENLQRCFGQSYNWNGQILDSDTTICVTFSSLNGCDSTHCITMDFYFAVPQPIITGDTTFCPGGSTTLSTTGFVAYQWSVPGAATSTLEVPGSGLYTVTVTDSNGCTATAAQMAIASAAILASWDLVPPDCAGSSNGWIELQTIQGGAAPFSYRFNGEAATSEPFFDNLAGGMYTIEIQDAAGCMSDTLISLSETPPLTVYLGPDLQVSPGSSSQLSAQVGSAQGVVSYLWSPASGLACADCPDPAVSVVDTAIYTLIVTDANGCTAVDSIRISVQNPDFVYVPNVFSPDDDGVNDFFGVFADPDKVQAVELLRVYDRWGSLVHESTGGSINDTTSGWNGLYRGGLLAQGIYVWYASIRLTDGTLLEKSGDVLLQR